MYMLMLDSSHSPDQTVILVHQIPPRASPAHLIPLQFLALLQLVHLLHYQKGYIILIIVFKRYLCLTSTNLTVASS